MGNEVASFTGAWIETYQRESMPGYLQSHPLRVRGLKLKMRLFYDNAAASHPLRVRGLKHCSPSFSLSLIVASFTGAWIETDNQKHTVK